MATYSINKIKLPNGDIVTLDGGEGTVTNVSVANTGGLTVTGSPITSTGTISIGHANASITAQTTQAVYPIKIDTYGHITSYGTEVTIPTVYNAALTFKKGASTLGSFTANTSTAATVTFATTSLEDELTFDAGALPTLGTSIPADDITSWVTNTPTVIDTTKFNGGSFTRGTFTGGSFTQGTDSFTANTPTVINTAKFSGGSFTRGTFTANTPTSVTYTVSGGTTSASPGTLILSVTEGTAATHSADSFTAASLQSGFYTAGTAASFTQGTDSFTAATHAADSFTAASFSSGFYTAGTAASLSYTAKNIPNVTSAGTLPSLTIANNTLISNVTYS